ncbi:MAG: hypothetical protein JRH20_28395 [Deltaproteobacteria bacterium]|nr:hypothetical protein [Deltaproteobacteria bacterium]
MICKEPSLILAVRGRHGGAGTAILMGSEPYDFWGLAAASTHDVEIRNNVAVGGDGIAWWKSPLTSANVAQNNVLIEAGASRLGNAAGWQLGGNAWLNKALPSMA